eukprot:scpid104902/ scgid12770/ 
MDLYTATETSQKVLSWLAGLTATLPTGLKCALKQVHAVKKEVTSDSAGCAACTPMRCSLPARKYSMLHTCQYEYMEVQSCTCMYTIRYVTNVWDLVPKTTWL